MAKTEQVEKFNDLLLKWASRECRDFIWRHNRTPYKVFIAETLLKRTTSTAAVRQYLLFIKKYPDIYHLATVDLEELVKIIRPIGLYKQRAKGLLEASRFVVDNYNGEFPKDFEALVGIPHIGPYIAACILSFGMDIPAPTVDSNVFRVLSRVFKDDLGEKPPLKSVMSLAWELLPNKEHLLFNYGLIDFGALVCTYRGCSGKTCPLVEVCNTLNDSTL